MLDKKTVIYIGDFDFENQNVQSRLVRNNAIILNELGYRVVFIGINRKINDITHFKKTIMGSNEYIELPNTLNFKGLFKWKIICEVILKQINYENENGSLKYVITYQCPTYAFAIKSIGNWCKQKRIAYIVNCADIPLFSSQPFFKKMVMKMNWRLLHKYNKKYANGVIAVSRYIESFYKKNKCAFAIIPPLFPKQIFVSNNKSIAGRPATFVYAGTPFIKTRKQIKNNGMKDRLDLVIDIFISLNCANVPFLFQIIGITKKEYLAGVPRHKKALVNIENISFLGEMPHNQVIECIKSADYSINYRDDTIMSRAGFSTKVVESISVGTPIVANKTSDIDLYLEKGTDWFPLSNNVGENFKQIKQLCELSSQARANNRKIIIEKRVFSPDRFLDKMDTFLKEINVF